MFTIVDRSWHRRTQDSSNPDSDSPLIKKEAIELAKSSARAGGYKSWSLIVESATQKDDHSWTVLLDASCIANECRDHLFVPVPVGDPYKARIFVYGADNVRACPHIGT
jgi:hypothetical protein